MTRAERIQSDSEWYERVVARAKDAGNLHLYESDAAKVNFSHGLLRDDRDHGGYALLERYIWGSRSLTLVPSDGRPALRGLV